MSTGLNNNNKTTKSMEHEIKDITLDTVNSNTLNLLQKKKEDKTLEVEVRKKESIIFCHQA